MYSQKEKVNNNSKELSKFNNLRAYESKQIDFKEYCQSIFGSEENWEVITMERDMVRCYIYIYIYIIRNRTVGKMEN